MLSVLLALVGLLVGALINVLADDLPARVRPRLPHCPQCQYVYGPAGWLATGRRLRGGACPNCGLPARPRTLLVEIGTAALFALLPLFIKPGVDLIVGAFYMAILILIIVIDLEHRLILHVVTLPTTAVALAASLIVSDNSLLSALVGAAFGLVFFYLAFLIGQKLFGSGALGFGDVTLAMTLGAMLGFHRIIFALVLGILLGGLWGLFALASGRISRRTHFAYGPFLAVGGMVMIIWGMQVVNWYTNP
ncbi:MAG: A24 family peptidase [Chloroflexi bacterium]|nr:A24 family peptidase [Chloroflexota bacterium]MCI0579752.1 A24 family peptidase [Chloroflexota bacterium]MCI0648321.1 A24 family peptidase [Chloroflexota bacterium]MCI0726557.1 A24 family peptidase [Chloroflexota bacterium]